MRVLLAPDSFKGSARADVAAAAIAAGWRRERPADVLTLVPMADGGEGTAEVLARGLPGAWRTTAVAGPDGREVRGRWWLTRDGVAVLDLAAFSGMELMGAVDPMGAHTLGFGQAIRAALDEGAVRLVLGLGGSASNDGGTGLLRALGLRFLDRGGNTVEPGAAGLHRIARLDGTRLAALPHEGVDVLTDVSCPLLGPSGAARMFGPQKGADAEQVECIDSGLAHLARLLGEDPDLPGTGAAGGAGFALAHWGGALRPGAAAVGSLLGLPGLVADQDVIITGEGSYDEQTATGKVAAYVADLAAEHGRPALLVTGRTTVPTAPRFVAAVSTGDLAGSPTRAIAEATTWLEHAGALLARDRTRRGR